MPPLQSAYSSVSLDTCALPRPLEPGDEMVAAADQQLRHLPRRCRHSEPADARHRRQSRNRSDRVRAVMAAIDSYSKRLSPPGSLIGISTIHFVKWLLIDNGRRLMMVSDYDGSWESYIDEFAEMILSGLDAIWETLVRLSRPMARATCRPSSGSCAATRCPPRCSSAPTRRDGAEHRQRSRAGRVRATTLDRPTARSAPSALTMATTTTRLPDDVLADVQGFITSGYGHLSHAAYLFVEFRDPLRAQRWVGSVSPAITTARAWPTLPSGEKIKPAVAVNIAFTAAGLAALGVPESVRCTFPVEFREGIAAEHRSQNSRRHRRERPGEVGTGRPDAPADPRRGD